MAHSTRDPIDPPGNPGREGAGPLPSDLLAIREKLKRARAERGACPPWDELRADLLPGGGARAGRAERIAHFEICPYCDAHVTEWKKSFDHTSDTLGAIERGVARGIVRGAKGLAGKIVTSARRPSGGTRPSDADEGERDAIDDFTVATPPADVPAPYVPPPVSPAPSEAAPPRQPRPQPPAPAAPVALPAPRAPARPPREVPAPTGGLIVVECVRGRVPPDSVFLCAGALGLEVACVESIDELADDPDLADVQAILIASDRDPADWPQTVRAARKLVPGRTVLVLSMFAQEPSKGARRALGEALLPASVSAEELLLALDRRLR